MLIEFENVICIFYKLLNLLFLKRLKKFSIFNKCRTEAYGWKNKLFANIFDYLVQRVCPLSLYTSILLNAGKNGWKNYEKEEQN